jgi:hypothetical protein
MEVEQAFGTGQQKQHQSKFCLKLMLIDSRMAKRTGIAFACSTRNQRSWYVVFERVRRERPRAARARLVPLYLQSAAHQAVQHWHILQLIFNHNHHFHHKLINSHCWDFPYELHMGKMCYSPPRGSNADWWLSTIANAARTNGLTCHPQHGVARYSKFVATHPFTIHDDTCRGANESSSSNFITAP